jgi:hypothetical protein
MGTTSHNYVERAKAILDGIGGPISAEAMAVKAQTCATLAVAAELHDLNQHLRGASNGAPAPTKER